MYKLCLLGNGASLKIKIFERENPDADNLSDTNWLLVHVNVGVSNFSASYDATFTMQDFKRLNYGISKSLTNLQEQPEVEFSTPEEMLKFSLKFTLTGTVIISGKSKTVTVPGASLKFNFETDLYTVEKFNMNLENMLIDLN